MKFSLRDFADLFSTIIRPEDDAVLLHSGIWKFGSRINIPIRELPFKLLDTIIEVLGPQRTLLLPTYTLSFTRTRKFDYKNSKPETGILSEVFLQNANTRRTLSAMNSYGVQGPLADQICRIHGQTLWGKGSVMEWIQQHNVRICVLGLPWHESCTFFHYPEEFTRVPYRYYKAFRGAWCNDAREMREWTEVMYVRPLDINVEYRWEIIAEEMARRDMILSAHSKEIPMESAKAQHILDVSLDLLRDDPYAFLTKKQEARDWVKNGRDKERARLKDDEKYSE